MQSFCIAAGLNHRVRPIYDDHEELIEARFEVFYGTWYVLGVERLPMQIHATRAYSEYYDAAVRFMVAVDISR